MSDKIAIIELGRLGDILSLIPAAFDIHRGGTEIDWFVCEEFAPILDAFPWITPIIADCSVKEPGKAYLQAIGDDPDKMPYSRVACCQVDGNPFPHKVKGEHYNLDSWRYLGADIASYGVLPLVPDLSKIPAWKPKKGELGKKKNIAICTKSISSPFKRATDLEVVLTEIGSKLGCRVHEWPKFNHPATAFSFLAKMDALISIDTFPLHASYGSGTPVIALVPDNQYDQTAPRVNWIGRVKYSEALSPRGHELIEEALLTVTQGRVKTGTMMRKAAKDSVAADSSSSLSILAPDRPAHGKLLSIVVLSVPQREAFLARLMKGLRPQVLADPDAVELIVDVKPKHADGGPTIGARRNWGLKAARGEWITFVDDDDMVSDDYVKSILAVLRKNNPDTVGFGVQRFESKHDHMIRIGTQKISNAFKIDQTIQRGSHTEFTRIPRHINPVKTWIARKVGFQETGPTAMIGEDVDFANRLRASGLIKTESLIDKELYIYEKRNDAEKSAEKFVPRWEVPEPEDEDEE